MKMKNCYLIHGSPPQRPIQKNQKTGEFFCIRKGGNREGEI
jgi:hypothetical protein